MRRILRRSAFLSVCVGVASAPIALADIPGATISRLTGVSSVNAAHLAAGPDGNVWFIDEPNATVGKLTISGTTATATTYSIKPNLPSGQGPNIDFARAIAGGPDAVWFSVRACPNLAGTNCKTDLGRVTANGTMTIVAISGESQPTKAMVVGPDGNLWMTFDNHVSRVTPDGTATVFNPPSGCCSGAIIVGPDQNVWFGDSRAAGNHLDTITTSGAITEFRASFVGSLVGGPDGNLWYASQDVPDKIARMTPSGQETLFTLPERAYIGGLAAGADGNIWFTEHFDPKIGQFVIATGATNIQSFSGSGKGGDIVPMSFPSASAHITPNINAADGFLATFKDISGGGDIVKIAVALARGAPDLIVTKRHHVSFLGWTNGPISLYYDGAVKNIGTAATTGTVHVTDTLPTQFLPDPLPDFKSEWLTLALDQSTDTFTCDIDVPGGIKPEQTINFQIIGRLIPITGEVITNQVTVSGGGDVNSANNTYIDSFTAGLSVLEVTKSHTGDRLLGTFQWTIKVRNVGRIPTDGPVTIVDKPPSDVQFGFGDLLGVECMFLQGSADCKTSNALPVGGSISIPLRVFSIPTTGKIVNRALAYGGGSDGAFADDVVLERAAGAINNPSPQTTSGRRP